MATVPDNYESGNDLATESDLEFFARLDHHDATTRARLEATYPTYEPTRQDLDEMAAWSQSVQDHDEALHLWLTFFPEAEKSTYYVS